MQAAEVSGGPWSWARCAVCCSGGRGAPQLLLSGPGPPGPHRGRKPSRLDVQRLRPKKPPSCAPSWKAHRDSGRATAPVTRALRACRTRLLGPRPRGAWAPRPPAPGLAPSGGSCRSRVRSWSVGLRAGGRRRDSALGTARRNRVRTGPAAVRPARRGPGGTTGPSCVWTGPSVFRVLRTWGRRVPR